MKIIDLSRKLLDRPVLVFALLIGIFGLISVFSQPPMAVNDEISHFLRANEISHGSLVTPKLSDGRFGAKAPIVFFDMDKINTYNRYGKPNPDKIRSDIAHLQQYSINQKDKGEIGWSNTAQYSAFAYLPQAIAITVGRIFNMSAVNTLYMTRIVVLLCYGLLVALAIKLTPVRKWLFVAVGLLPMCVQEAASVSIDALLIAACMVGLAGFFYVYTTKKLAVPFGTRLVPLLPILTLAITYVALAKFVYFPLFLVLLLLPVSTFKTKARKWRFMAVALLVPFILLIGWNGLLAVRGSAEAQRLSITAAGIYPPDAKTGVKNLLHPGYTTKLLYYTYFSQVDNGNIIPNYITTGIFANFTSFFIPGPNWYIMVIAFGLLFSFCLVDAKTLVFSRYFKWLTLGGLAVAAAGITFSMYFYTTTNMQSFINGVQGRYFIPLIIPLVILMSRQGIIRITNAYRTKAMLVAILTFNLVFMQMLYFQWFWRP